MIIQILVTVFVAIILIKAIADTVKKKMSARQLFVWLMFWALALVIFWYPNLTQKIASWLGVGRGTDAVFYISVVVVFYVIFKMYNRLEKVDNDLTTLVRKIALLEKKENDK